MTWTVEDTAYMLQAIAGHDPGDPTSSTAPVPDYSLSLREDIKGLTIGVPRHFFFAPHPTVNPEVLSIVEKGLQDLQKLGAILGGGHCTQPGLRTRREFGDHAK